MIRHGEEKGEEKGKEEQEKKKHPPQERGGGKGWPPSPRSFQTFLPTTAAPVGAQPHLPPLPTLPRSGFLDTLIFYRARECASYKLKWVYWVEMVRVSEAPPIPNDN